MYIAYTHKRKTNVKDVKHRDLEYISIDLQPCLERLADKFIFNDSKPIKDQFVHVAHENVYVSKNRHKPKYGSYQYLIVIKWVNEFRFII